MQKKKIFILTIALLVVFVLAGCGKNDQTKTNSKTDNNSAEETTGTPDEVVLNEETEECEPKEDDTKGKMEEKEVSIIDILQADYRDVLRGYQEYPEYNAARLRSSGEKRPLRNSINGHSLYYKILSYIPQKELIFSIGYLDNDKNWTEHKRFVSYSSGKSMTGYRYKGKLLKLDDPDYYCTKNANLKILTNPIMLELGDSFQCNDGEGEYRIVANTEVKTIILNSEEDQPINEIVTSETKNEYNKYAYPYIEVPLLKNSTHDVSVRYAWDDTRKTIDGFSSYYRILSYKEEGYNKELIVSFGYISDNRWVEYKRFTTLDDYSEECVNRKNGIRQEFSGKYCGKIVQTDTYNYKCSVNGLDLLTEDPPRLDLNYKFFRYLDKTNGGVRYQIFDDPERGMIILN